MKIDFDSQGLYYSIDGDQYVKTNYKINNNTSYRLLVGFVENPDHQVELL